MFKSGFWIFLSLGIAVIALITSIIAIKIIDARGEIKEYISYPAVSVIVEPTASPSATAIPTLAKLNKKKLNPINTLMPTQ